MDAITRKGRSGGMIPGMTSVSPIDMILSPNGALRHRWHLRKTLFFTLTGLRLIRKEDVFMLLTREITGYVS